MSLTGIAIAIGVLVDAAIVMTENVIRHCEEAERRKGTHAHPRRKRCDGHARGVAQVGRPIFFAMAIIILAFVPVFALTGQEGKLFHPLAFTKTFAMIGSTLLAVTIVPCSVRTLGARAVSFRGAQHGHALAACASTIQCWTGRCDIAAVVILSGDDLLAFAAHSLSVCHGHGEMASAKPVGRVLRISGWFRQRVHAAAQ